MIDDLVPAPLDSIPIMWSRRIDEGQMFMADISPRWVIAHPLDYARCFPTPTKDPSLILERLAVVWVRDAMDAFDSLAARRISRDRSTGESEQ